LNASLRFEHAILPPPMTDPKQGEREYFARIGEEGRKHALRKPFSDDHCLEYLANVTTLMSLLRPPPARIVEFGCGTGWLGQLFAQRGYEVIGVDISPEAIAMAEQLKLERGLSNATYLVADYEDVKIDPPADYVLFHDAFHHAESEIAAMRAAYNALVPEGMVLCIEPGEGHSQSESSRRAVEEFGVHEKDMPPRTIIRHGRAAGFRRHLVLPWPWFHLRSVYRPAYSDTRTQFDLRAKKFLSLVRLFKYFFRTRRQGLVLLWKR
jgi:SAM-dependent methyltransferase